MSNIEIGILISNNEDQIIGYSKKKGFFVCKELFFNEDFYKNNIDQNVIWFSNISRAKINIKNIKSNDFFDINITDMISFYGLNNIYKKNLPDFKTILEKFYNFLKIKIDNFSEIFRKIDLEKINKKEVNQRIKNRFNILLEADNYKDALLNIKKNYNSSLVTNIVNNENNTKSKIIPFNFYNKDLFKDNTQNEDKNLKKINILENGKLNKDNFKIINKKKFELKLNLLNINIFLDFNNFEFYEMENYKISSLGDVFDINKKNKEILKIENILFYYIKVLKVPKVRIFKNLINKKFWVSKKELEFYILNDFLISIDYIFEENVNILKDSFTIQTTGLIESMNENILNSNYHQYIHLYNYLQIIELNDNYILKNSINSFIKSYIMNIILLIEKRNLEIISYDQTSITVSYNEEDKIRIRMFCEEMKIDYPAIII